MLAALGLRPVAEATSWPVNRPEQTRNLLRAIQLLFQLSYTPMDIGKGFR